MKACLDQRFYRCIEGGVKTGIACSNANVDLIIFTGGT